VTRSIWKHVLLEYTLEVAAVDPVVRFVGADPATGCPAVWIEQTVGTLAAPEEHWRLIAIATGERIKDNEQYIGTAVTGSTVWHIHKVN
jgi:hypothetical protein